MSDSYSLSKKSFDAADAFDVFSRAGWMSKRTEPVRRLLLSHGRPRTFAAGETLYRIGDAPDGLYGLIRGQVCISIPNDAGSVMDCYMGNPGFWIGDLALLAKSARLVTVTATVPIDVWYLPQTALLDLLRPHPELVADFYALNHMNTATALRLLANLAIPDTQRRLAAWLLFTDEGVRDPGAWLDASQDQIAMMNAVSLATVRRSLKQLETLGLIELGYSRLRVRDRPGLTEFCSG